MYKNIILIFIFIFAFKAQMTGQDIQLIFERISIDHGLSQNTVTSIFQDNKGFLWFGTYDGLNRYDGVELRVFKHDDGDSNSISHNSITTIYEDRYHNLFIGTFGGGLSLYDKEKEIFKRFKIDPDNPRTLNNENIRCIYEDKAGNLWLGSWGGGLSLLDRESFEFTHFKHDPEDVNSITDDRLNDITEDKDGNLWIATSRGVCKFNPRTHHFTHFQHDKDDPHSLSLDDASSIHIDNFGDVWVGTWGGGLNQLDTRKNKFHRYLYNSNDENSIGHNIIKTIFSDDEGNLLVGTWGNGIEMLDKSRKKFTSIVNNPGNPNSISGNFIYSIYKDRSGIIWIGTDYKGLNKFDPKNKNFIHYKNDPQNPKSLSDNIVSSILKGKDDNIWLGTAGGGINKFNPKTKEFNNYLFDPGNPYSIKSMAQDNKGIIWAATETKLISFNPSNGKVKDYKHDPNDPKTISFHNVWKIYLDKNDDLWIGLFSGGLDKFDQENDKFIHFKHNPNDSTSISDDYIWSILEDRQGNFWVGTDNGGLNLMDRKTGTFIHYKHIPNDKNSLSDNKVLSIFEDSSERLWIGTTVGLNQFDRKKKQFIHYRERDGLPNNTVQAIIEDRRGYLWISTQDGLSKFDPDEKTFQNFDVSNGLQSNEFCVNACYITDKNEMYFGGVNGFNIFTPDSIKKNAEIPSIVLTDFQLFNRQVSISGNSKEPTVLKKSITETDSLVLSHEDQIFSFEFAALDFRHPENNKYAYMMEGFEKNWNFVGNRNFVTYTNLPAGSYIFRVKGSNNDGIWNPSGVKLYLEILPPFWQTIWFQLFIALLILSLAYSFYKWRVKNIQKRNKILLKETEVQRQIAKAEEEKNHIELQLMQSQKTEAIGRLTGGVAHDFNNLLTLINGYADISLMKMDETDKSYNSFLQIREAGRRAANLTNQLLAFSRKQTMQPKVLDMNLLLKKMENMLSRLISENISITCKYSENLKTVKADPNQMEQVILNLVLNASDSMPEGGKISIETSNITLNTDDIKNYTGFKPGAYTMISIADTGSGMDDRILARIFEPFFTTKEQGKGTGLGLSMVYGIIKQSKGYIYADSVPNKGTTFKIYLNPVEQKIAPVPEVPLEEETQEGDETILIVEDESAVLTLTSKVLIDHGYQIHSVASGQEALKVIQKNNIDLLLTDVFLQGMNGRELSEKIVAYKPNLPVIYMSGYTANIFGENGILDEKTDFIQKPFSPLSLLKKVRSVLDKV